MGFWSTRAFVWNCTAQILLQVHLHNWLTQHLHNWLNQEACYLEAGASSFDPFNPVLGSPGSWTPLPHSLLAHVQERLPRSQLVAHWTILLENRIWQAGAIGHQAFSTWWNHIAQPHTSWFTDEAKLHCFWAKGCYSKHVLMAEGAVALRAITLTKFLCSKLWQLPGLYRKYTVTWGLNEYLW